MSKQTLRDYQQRGLEIAVRHVRESRPGSKLLLAAPCATGKGTLQLDLLEELRQMGRDAWLTTPSIEIMRGNLERMGLACPDNGDAVADLAWRHSFTTPVRLLNRIAKGEVQPPEVLIVDEVHSFVDSNTVPDQLFAICAESRWIGFTATPYRATAKGTDALRALWGEPEWLLRLPEAVSKSHILAPELVLRALVDDDLIRVVGGEIDASGAEAAYEDRLAGLVEIVREQHSDGRRIVVSVPGTSTARSLAEALEASGVPASAVLQDTPGAERMAIYADARHGEARRVLVQIRVLSVGADLPELDCLIDAQPTMSPVLWLQTVGRIMRQAKGKRRPRLIATNRNVERWVHLLEGVVPAGAAAVESQEAFGGPTQRGGGARALGFENLAAKKMLKVPLVDGGYLSFYSLTTLEDGSAVDYFVAWLPGATKPMAARRENKRSSERTEFGNLKTLYGKWEPCELASDLSGFSTSNRRESMSEKQAAWWAKSAAYVGLAPTDPFGEQLELSGREFAALPVAKDCKWYYGERQQRAGSASKSERGSAQVSTGGMGLADAFALLAAGGVE